MSDAASTEPGLRTWKLDERDIPDAIAKLERINTRAARNGLGGRFSWTLGEECHEPVYLAPHPVPGAKPDYYKVTRELIVSGDAPKLAGWTFQARLTWDEDVLVTRCTPGFEGRIDESSIRQGACDHCQLDRDRLDCYLLAHDDGRTVQVGSSCVKDFLGQDFRPFWITYAASLDELEDGVRTHVTASAPALDVLTWAASISAKTGWVSRARADAEYRMASADTLRSCLFPRNRKDEELCAEYRPDASQTAEAATVLGWAQAIEPGASEYLANLQRVASAEWVGERNVAILGSAVASYHREMTAKAEREARPVSQHVGQVKDRLELALTVCGDTAIEGDYGVTHLYTMTDPDGNVFKWFSSRNQSWEVGQDVRVKGTIKGHATYRDVAQTVLTRCTEISAEKEAAA